MSGFQAYTDLQLLVSLKEGDEAAFTELYHRYWEKLYRSACKKLGSTEDAREIVHDVLLDIWKRRAELSIEYPAAYFEKAIRFRVINHVKRKKSTTLIDSFEAALYSPFHADSQVEMNEFLRLLESWIGLLPPKQAQIFIKYYIESLSADEIAAEMGLSKKTIQNNLSMAVQFLKERIRHLPLWLILLLEAPR